MKLALIPPIDLLEEVPNTGIHLVLPHMLKNPKYRDFYKSIAGYKILDNGAAEGVIEADLQKLIDLALEYNFDEVVIPDVMGDMPASRKLIERYSNIDTYGLRLMAVAHADNFFSLLAYTQWLVDIPVVNVIGLPRLLGNKLFPTVRLLAASAINGAKPVHCLGANNWIAEVEWLASSGKVRSMDTSLPFALGMRNISVDTGPYVGRIENYFEASISKELKEVILDNVKSYLRWCEAPFSRLLKLYS